MAWAPPEVSEDQSSSSWSPPEVSGWTPPEVAATETSTTPRPSLSDFAEANRAQMGALNAPSLPEGTVTPAKVDEQTALTREMVQSPSLESPPIAPAPNTPEFPGGVSEPIGSAFAGLLPRASTGVIPFHKLGTTGQVAVGTINGAEELVEGVAQYLTSPQGLVELGLTKTPVAPAVMVKWAKDMVEGGLINAGEAKDAWNRGDKEGFAKHVILGAGMLFGAGGIVHKGVAAPISDFARGSARLGEANLKALEATMPPALRELAPDTAKAVAETFSEVPASSSKPIETVAVESPKTTAPQPPVYTPDHIKERATRMTRNDLTANRSLAESEFRAAMSEKRFDDASRLAAEVQFYREELDNRQKADSQSEPSPAPSDEPVVEKSLTTEPARAVPGEVKAKEPSVKKQTPLQQLDAFVAEHGMEQGWVTNPDAFYAEIGKGGDTASVKARLAKNKAAQAARQNAIRDLKLGPTDSTLPKDVLPKLQSLIAEKSKSIPKLRPGEKGTGDLLQDDAPFNLAGEKGVDVDRIAAEKKAKADTEKAAADFDKENQRELLEEDLVEGPFAIGTPGPPLAPAAAGSVSLPPKSQRQIITDIAKGLKLPIRFGRLTTSKFAGYFKSVANLIGSKKADDIPIVSHEAGHKLDNAFGLSSDTSLRAELDVLGDPTTPGSRSSWTKSKTRKYKMGEGVAEFVRYWLTDPAHAQQIAPNTFAAFERALNGNKDFGDTMRQAQEDIALWRNADPQARLRSQISVGENPNKTRYTASQLTRDLVDDLHILRLATLDAAPKWSTLKPSENPYLMARNLRGSYGMAATFIRDGIVDFKTKAVRLGTSLEDALKPVAGRLNDFRDWIVAKRAQELRSQGRESGLVPSDVDAVAAKFDADPDFQRAFTAVKNWNDALLQYAVDADLIQKGSPRTPTSSPTGSYAIREMNQDYVPFHRVFEIGAGESPSQSPQGIGMGLNVGKPGSLKALHGSTRQIVDPLETMVKNAYTIITASEKAAINTAVADLSKLPDMGKWVERVATPKENVPVELEKIKKQLEAAGADLTAVPDDLLMSFFRQSRSAPFGENIIRVVRNGKAEFYRLNRDLHDTFQALDLEDTGKLVRILSSPAQLLRAGVVLEPSFNIANVLRDTFSAAVIGKYGAFPFETTLKGMAAMVKDPKLVAEWAASGGKSAVEASYFDRAKLQKFLAERISKDLTPSERALIVSRSPLSALRWLSSTFEEATRVGEYKIAYDQLRKSGMPEGEARRQAAFEARDRQDFAKGGAKTKIIRHMAAFWNAGLQANVKLAQAFKERPVRTTLQGLAFITLPKMIEQAINWDDDDYWARKQWERDMFFLIPIGKGKTGHTRFLRIPTPFEVGVIFGTFPGRILQALKEKNPDSMKSFPSLVLKQSVPNPIPQGMQVVFEDFLSGKKGWDVWRGRTIVPESLADEPPELQYTEQTSALAKKTGQAVGFSPMKIDHLIERTTGGIGKLLTGRSVPGQRFVTAPLPVSNQATETFYDRLEAIREDAARAKASNKPMPKYYGAFQSTERALSEMRKRARETKDLDQKARLQDQMLKTTTEFLKRHPQ